MNQEDKISRKIADSYKEAGPYLGLGTQLAATIVLMFFVGKWLDEKLNTHPILTLVLSFFGGFAGIYNFIKSVLHLNEKKKLEKND